MYVRTYTYVLCIILLDDACMHVLLLAYYHRLRTKVRIEDIQYVSYDRIPGEYLSRIRLGSDGTDKPLLHFTTSVSSQEPKLPAI